MGPAENTSSGRAFVTALVLLLVAALGAAVVYLLSDINSRRYRIAVQENNVVVEKGRKLPWGFARFEPTTPELKVAYAPIAVPPGDALAKTEVYDDRADVDRALFSLLAGWARTRLDSTSPGDFELAAGYVRKSESLPSLSEEQRLELRRLRADLSYRNGRRMLADITDRLQKALAELKMARELGATKPADVDQWIAEVERRLSDYAAPPPPVTTLQPTGSGVAAEAPLSLTPEPPGTVKNEGKTPQAP